LKTFPNRPKVYALGTGGLIQELQSKGFEVIHHEGSDTSSRITSQTDFINIETDPDVKAVVNPLIMCITHANLLLSFIR
jgi:hypothetical protein